MTERDRWVAVVKIYWLELCGHITNGQQDEHHQQHQMVEVGYSPRDGWTNTQMNNNDDQPDKRETNNDNTRDRDGVLIGSKDRKSRKKKR